MLLFFEPTIVAKTNVTLPQSPPLSLHLMLIYERLTQRVTEYLLLCNIELGVKKDNNKNIKVDFLVLH